MTISSINRDAISAAESEIRRYIRRTPVMELEGKLDLFLGRTWTLKLEQLQRAGSFKTRGAFTHLLTRTLSNAGVVAASGGNHGAAVAYAAMQLAQHGRIYVPTISSPAKIERIRTYGDANRRNLGIGVDLVVSGANYAEALAASEEWARQTGATTVHAFDQDETLIGQGTLALELEQQAPDLDTILVAVGGGGLMGGIAAWYEGRAQIVGVEPEESPTLSMALAAGHPVDAPVGGIAADSLGPKRIGNRAFAIAQKFDVKSVLVPDSAIRDAQRFLWNTARIVAEPGGATAFAALISRRYEHKMGERVGIVISGANTTAVDFDR